MHRFVILKQKRRSLQSYFYILCQFPNSLYRTHQIKSNMLGETEETPALNRASRGGDDTKENGNCSAGSLEEALKLAGLGKFNLWLLFVCGLGQASNAIETACISFLLPSACDLNLTSDEKGWLNATLFLGMLIGSYISGLPLESRCFE